jgi:tRNA/tmRNA/rRNA uracil-C5-methylase (TrmA/RlmC/RlmD family)
MDLVELELGAPAAGGGFVARDPTGRVVFVRHGLRGERVRARLTDEHATWARADAVEILSPSPDRVDPPCPYAGPGRCGGCDYQHVALGVQRALKSERLADQLRRVAGLELDVEVEAIAPERAGLHTRTRVRFGTDPDGHLAMRQYRSHELVEVADCLLAAEPLRTAALTERAWPPGADVELVALGDGPPTVMVTQVPEVRARGTRATTMVLDNASFAARQSTVVRDQPYDVSPGVFWQVHERGPEVLVDAVLRGLALTEGDSVLDLYCGAGLFTKAVAPVVGPRGTVVGVDASDAATRDARTNLTGQPWARIVTARVEAKSVRAAVADATHAVLDPPRRGVPRGALEALSAAPLLRTVVSVSCDPSTFARDLRTLSDGGFQVRSVRALDLFEMTEHVECVAVLAR